MTTQDPSTKTNQMTRVAVVEDDHEIRQLVVDYLARDGFDVSGYPNGAAFDEGVARFQPDVVVLDLMMPGEDGLSICRRISPQVPVLVLSAKGEELDRIIGLEVGADDYLAKPFNPRELVARIRAVLRRKDHGSPAAVTPPPSGTDAAASAPLGSAREVLVFDGWTLDVDGRRLSDPSQAEVALSSGEFALLTEFARRPQRVLSRERLLDWTRGDASDAFDRAIDVQLSRLRKKLADRGGTGLIKTIRGDGYLFSAQVRRSGASSK
ncbi:MAG: response regulator transcription factor [Pseudomonadota bacterium]